ncbi:MULTISPECIES: hypothetical protein [unclassified Thiocapsa]|uniref:hypothetical protein n=1 Tax=unclassified Thiocapsa TaxID=2641286 RepID=UPI0035B03A26
MAPCVLDGALVDVGGPARIYWPGDVVVVLLDGNRLALHRVIGAYRRAGAWKVLTQGDTAPRPDTAVRPERILGHVRSGDCDRSLIAIPLRHRLRAAGRFVRFALGRLGRGVCA